MPKVKISNLNFGHLISASCQIKAPKRLNLDKSEITNYKHQITNTFQNSISKSQISSKTICLEF